MTLSVPTGKAQTAKEGKEVKTAEVVGPDKTAGDRNRELLLGYHKFHRLWVEKLSNVNQRKGKAKP